MGLWDHGNLGPWDFGTMGLWDCGILGPLDFGTMGLWDHGTLGPWDQMSLRPQDFEIMELGTMGFQDH